MGQLVKIQSDEPSLAASRVAFQLDGIIAALLEEQGFPIKDRVETVVMQRPQAGKYKGKKDDPLLSSKESAEERCGEEEKNSQGEEQGPCAQP